MSGRLRVVIATTAGPSTVRRITAEDPALRSVVCLAGTATALPISGDYDAFVRRPTGVVERDTGQRVYRVDVDRPIDDGRSWQLGFYLAHQLKLADRLAEDDAPAEGIVWATGTVDSDLKVGPVARVADKARRSAAILAAGPPVLAVAAVDHADDLPAGAAPLAVRSVDEALAHLGLVAPADRGPVDWGRAGRGGGVLGVALLLGGAAIVWGLWQTPRSQPATEMPPAAGQLAAGQPAAPSAGSVPVFAPARVSFDVLESRPVGDACGPADVADPGPQGPREVCAVAFRATNAGERPVRIWLYGAVQGGVREYASRRRHTELAVGILAPGEAAEVRVQPPDWVRRSIDVRGLLVLADGDRPQVAQAFGAIDLLSSAEIDALVDGLHDQDVEVREILHRVIPAR